MWTATDARDALSLTGDRQYALVDGWLAFDTDAVAPTAAMTTTTTTTPVTATTRCGERSHKKRRVAVQPLKSPIQTSSPVSPSMLNASPPFLLFHASPPPTSSRSWTPSYPTSPSSPRSWMPPLSPTPPDSPGPVSLSPSASASSATSSSTSTDPPSPSSVFEWLPPSLSVSPRLSPLSFASPTRWSSTHTSPGGPSGLGSEGEPRSAPTSPWSPLSSNSSVASAPDLPVFSAVLSLAAAPAQQWVPPWERTARYTSAQADSFDISQHTRGLEGTQLLRRLAVVYVGLSSIRLQRQEVVAAADGASPAAASSITVRLTFVCVSRCCAKQKIWMEWLQLGILTVRARLVGSPSHEGPGERKVARAVAKLHVVQPPTCLRTRKGFVVDVELVYHNRLAHASKKKKYAVPTTSAEEETVLAIDIYDPASATVLDTVTFPLRLDCSFV